MSSAPRPRVLCIQPRPQPSTGAVAAGTSGDWMKTLGLHAEILVLDTDFDLGEVCQRFNPDLVIVEAVGAARPWPLTIANPGACPTVPRLLLMAGAPHDPLRGLAMRVADDLGVEAVFVTGEAYRQHMPELRHLPCHFVPPCVDEAMFRDRGLDRTITVSMFTDAAWPGLNPWCAQTLPEMKRTVPTLAYTHPGLGQASEGLLEVAGEDYAGLLNRSRFSAADTTRLDYGTGKHLEIPASGAVLVGPESEALKSFGFVDGENCLLGSGLDLMARIESMGRDPAAYARVRDAGCKLVQTRYTAGMWRQMLDWLECRRQLKPGQVIQQVGRYGPFRGMTPTASTTTVLAVPQPDSGMARTLRAARDAILSGTGLMQADMALGATSSGAEPLAEPLLLLAVLQLLAGDPLTAGIAIGRRAQIQAIVDEALGVFDPVETAWLLLIARLIGHAELESAMREQANAVSHVALRRVVWLLDGCLDDAAANDGLLSRLPGDLPSVHWLGEEDFTAWCDLVRRVLIANVTSPGTLAVSARLLAAA